MNNGAYESIFPIDFPLFYSTYELAFIYHGFDHLYANGFGNDKKRSMHNSHDANCLRELGHVR
jgi:hypothetical protein